jgi:4a-hydroxytetrahydrobiopterin dehydratase
MTEKRAEKTYTDAEVTERLKRELPGWTLADGHIVRRFKTSGWKASLMAANTIGHLAEAAWHHPDLRVAWGVVEVMLNTHSANGITDKDFALARKIEEVVMWQPAREGGALEGTPGDPKHAYIKYEESWLLR